MITSTALLTGHQFGEAMVPVIIGLTISEAVAGGAVQALLFWLAVLGADFLLLSMSYRFGARIGATVRLGIAHELRVRIIARALDERGGLDRHSSAGAVLSTATADARRVGETIRQAMGAFAAAAVVVFGVVMVALTSVLLAFVVAVGVVAVVVLLALLSAPLERRSGAEQQAAASTSALGADLLRGLRTIAGLGAERAAHGRYRAQSRISLGHAIAAGSFEGRLEGIGVAVVGCYLAVVAAIGGVLGLSGAIDIGQLIAVLGLSQFILGPLQTLGGFGAVAARGRASAKRITALLDAPVLLTGRGTVRDCSVPIGADGASISFEGVVLPGRDDARVLDVRIPSGGVTGLVVPDAERAQAIVDLLAGEALPEYGRVLLGEDDLAMTSPASWRERVLVSPHDATLFSGPVGQMIGAMPGAMTRVIPDVRPDIVRGMQSGAQDAWHVAVRAAAADDVIERLPDGARTVLTERGGTLSGGERQRIALARAIAAQPPVLVLHDPTTAVDSVTEVTIAARLGGARAGLTTIMVTTSPAILESCDRVIFIDGDVAAGVRDAASTHASLVAGDAAYRSAVLR